MNRASIGLELFTKDGDYLAFEKAMAEGLQRWPGVRVVTYCLMPNHFHMVLWPKADNEVSAYLRWVTMTFSHRWHAHRKSIGRGRVFQGRFKSFPVQRDGKVLAVCRYVERNPLRAGLVRRAQDWPWSSLACRLEALSGDPRRATALLSPWPIHRGTRGEPAKTDHDAQRNEEAEWLRRVNEPETAEELSALRNSAYRGTPLGSDRWVKSTARNLGLESSLRNRGRPRSAPASRKAGDKRA
jgi:putative transposase